MKKDVRAWGRSEENKWVNLYDVHHTGVRKISGSIYMMCTMYGFIGIEKSECLQIVRMNKKGKINLK